MPVFLDGMNLDAALRLMSRTSYKNIAPKGATLLFAKAGDQASEELASAEDVEQDDGGG
jgi:triphosphoribosyl-dephospho-CoA synthetase